MSEQVLTSGFIFSINKQKETKPGTINNPSPIQHARYQIQVILLNWVDHGLQPWPHHPRYFLSFS